MGTLSADQTTGADEGCGYADEGEEVVRLAFVATAKSAAAGEPGHGSFDDPSVAAQPLGGLDALTGDAVADASLAQPSAQVIVVVALVGMELSRLPAARTSTGEDRGDPSHKRFQTLAVMQVAAGDAQRERQSVPIGEQVDFRSGLATVGRIRSGQRPLRPPFR